MSVLLHCSGRPCPFSWKWKGLAAPSLLQLCWTVTMSSSTISTSLRIFATKIPTVSSTSHLPRKTLLFFSSNLNPTSLSSFIFSNPISFQNIPATRTPLPPAASTSASLQPMEELPPKLQEIIKLFQSVQEPKAKYEQLLFYGKNLNPLDAQFKTRENKVEGCVSQVWVRAYLDDGGDNRRVVIFEADSDSVLTKGLAALLVQGLSGRPVEEVLRVSPDFVTLLGLQQSLTPSRNNGFLNMLKLMQKKALQLYMESEKGGNGSSIGGGRSVMDDVKTSNLESNGAESGAAELNSEAKIGGGAESKLGGLGSRGMRIREKLEKELNPSELEIEDVSYQHAGHAGVRGNDSGETHFNLKVVSTEFEGKSLVKRHRLIYGLLQEELQSGLHALSIVAKTPAELEGN